MRHRPVLRPPSARRGSRAPLEGKPAAGVQCDVRVWETCLQKGIPVIGSSVQRGGAPAGAWPRRRRPSCSGSRLAHRGLRCCRGGRPGRSRGAQDAGASACRANESDGANFFLYQRRLVPIVSELPKYLCRYLNKQLRACCLGSRGIRVEMGMNFGVRSAVGRLCYIQ